MKFLNKLNLNAQSRIYLLGVIFTFIAMFIVMAVLFLFIIAGNLNIVMSQPAGETYAYFISLIYRILVLVMIFAIIPLSVYQFLSKEKSQIDRIISIIATLVIAFVVIIFLGGEVYYFKKYSSGELSYSSMFCKPTIETRLFDKYLEYTNASIPLMCQKHE